MRVSITDKEQNGWLEAIRFIWKDEHEQRILRSDFRDYYFLLRPYLLFCYRNKFLDRKILNENLSSSQFRPIVKMLNEKLEASNSKIYVDRARKLRKSFVPAPLLCLKIKG